MATAPSRHRGNSPNQARWAPSPSARSPRVATPASPSRPETAVYTSFLATALEASRALTTLTFPAFRAAASPSARNGGVYLFFGNGAGGFSGPHYVNLPGVSSGGLAIGPKRRCIPLFWQRRWRLLGPSLR